MMVKEGLTTLREFAEGRLSAEKLKAFSPARLTGTTAIIEIHPGAGGTEAQDWADMLVACICDGRERRGYKDRDHG